MLDDHEYVARKGNKCPYCESVALIGSNNIETDGDHACRDVMCTICRRKWTDLYLLVGYIESNRGE